MPLDQIDHRLPDLADWRILVALKNHPRPWDGLITTDSSVVTLPRELAVLHQTKLTLVVAEAAGHDPLKATGLVLAHLPGICQRSTPDRPQIWTLRTVEKNDVRAWDCLGKLARRAGISTQELFNANKLSDEALAANPLGPSSGT